MVTRPRPSRSRSRRPRSARKSWSGSRRRSVRETSELQKPAKTMKPERGSLWEGAVTRDGPDMRGPPHTPGISAKAAMMAGSVAGSKTPPTKPTRTDGKLGGKGKPTPFKPQSIVPPSMAVHGKT